MKKDWYDLKIEEPLKNLVKILRNNGFNTICSCGHTPKPYVQMESYGAFEVDKLYNLLIENRYKNFYIQYTQKSYDDLRDYGRCLEVIFYTRRKLANESDIRHEKKWEYETCKKCGKEQRLSWSVKDEIWKKVVGGFGGVYCLECFLKMADLKKIPVMKEDFNFFGWIAENTDGDIIIDKEMKE